MTSLKPYLIRAIYDWIINNKLTPHLLVDATHPQAALPKDYIEDGRIILNIRPEATQNLLMGDTAIEFNALFNGQPTLVQALVAAVLAIYAKENGKGMVFDDEEETPPSPEDSPPRPHLRVVK